MQRPHEQKRELITATAAKMFATQPFHKVRLEDIAAVAHIGKGTLYCYFKNKEDLYFSLIYDGYARLIKQLTEQLSRPLSSDIESPPDRGWPAVDGLRQIVAGLVSFAFQNPYFYEMIRSVGVGSLSQNTRGKTPPDWDRMRHELQQLIETTIRRGVRDGEFNDPNPELTAGCIPGLVRSVMLFGPKGLSKDAVISQLMRLLERGIVPSGNQRSSV